MTAIDDFEALLAQTGSTDGASEHAVAAPADGYSLVFVVFNTFFCLLDQGSQIECFANVAQRLAPGGRFLIEAFVPDLGRFDRGQRTSVLKVAVESVDIDVAVHDSVTQRVDGSHIVIRESATRLLPVSVRYAFPSELDLMARLAGLSLESREGGWTHEPFTGSSAMHVSVWSR